MTQAVWNALQARPSTMMVTMTKLWMTYNLLALIPMSWVLRSNSELTVAHWLGLGVAPLTSLLLSLALLRGFPPHAWHWGGVATWEGTNLAITSGTKSGQLWLGCIPLVLALLAQRPYLLSLLTGKQHWIRMQAIPEALWRPRPLPPELRISASAPPDQVESLDSEALRTLGLRADATFEDVQAAENAARRTLAAKKHELGIGEYKRQLLLVGRASERLQNQLRRHDEPRGGQEPDGLELWRQAIVRPEPGPEVVQAIQVLHFQNPTMLAQIATTHPAATANALLFVAPEFVRLYFPKPLSERVNAIAKPLKSRSNWGAVLGAGIGWLIGSLICDARGMRTALMPFYEAVVLPILSVLSVICFLLIFAEGLGCGIYLGLLAIWLVGGLLWLISSGIGSLFGAPEAFGILAYMLVFAGLGWSLMAAMHTPAKKAR